MLLLSFVAVPMTRGMFLQTEGSADYAFAAKFNVIITLPEEFKPVNGENILEYYFASDNEVKVLNFQIYNNGETDVICTPHISGGIVYRAFISGQEVTEFTLKTKETVNFHILMSAEGLSADARDAALFVDVRQMG